MYNDRVRTDFYSYTSDKTVMLLSVKTLEPARTTDLLAYKACNQSSRSPGYWRRYSIKKKKNI